MKDRDEFAVMAAEVFLERIDPPFTKDGFHEIAEKAYQFADAMIEARGEKKP